MIKLIKDLDDIVALAKKVDTYRSLYMGVTD